MESKTCGGGGSGFVTLTYKGKRLAYMMCREKTLFEFYEFWNKPAWESLVGDGDPLEALIAGFKDGTIDCRKIVRTPLGRVVARVFDMTQATIQAEGEETVTVGDTEMVLPKLLRMEGPDAVNGGTKELIVKETVEENRPALAKKVVIYIAMGEIAWDTSQVIGVFSDQPAAVQRCKDRVYSDEAESFKYDRHWIEEWEVDGNYIKSYEVLPDEVVEHV